MKVRVKKEEVNRQVNWGNFNLGTSDKDYIELEAEPLEPQAEGEKCSFGNPINCPCSKTEGDLCQCSDKCQGRCHPKAPKETNCKNPEHTKPCTLKVIDLDSDLPEIEEITIEAHNGYTWSGTHMTMFNKINQLVRAVNRLSQKK